MKKNTSDSATNTTSVREKASHRKGRTNKVVRSAKVPSQERSKKRYQLILDTTIELLKTSNIEDISLHDIGKACDLPPPSVHYLFNTVSAIHLALSDYYNESLTARILDHISSEGASHARSWQELVRDILDFARNEYNSDRALSEVLLAPVLHRSVRAISFETNSRYGSTALDLFKKYFSVPDIPNLATYFVFSTEMLEGMWAAAYARHGHIDDLTFEESVRATIAYLRCYLPETLAHAK